MKCQNKEINADLTSKQFRNPVSSKTYQNSRFGPVTARHLMKNLLLLVAALFGFSDFRIPVLVEKIFRILGFSDSEIYRII